MIRIVESAPIKMTGITTLKVTFPYNEAIIDVIKGYDSKYWHKSILTWEFPVTDLKQLLDDLTRFDDIELQLIDGKDFASSNLLNIRGATLVNTDHVDSKLLLTEDEISAFKVKPFDHQIEAINYGLTHDKFLLLDGCGVGKTNEIIWIAETLKRRGLIDHCLIICGVNFLKQNWKNAIAKFSTESCRVLGEKITKRGTVKYDTVENRKKELMGEFEEFFVITNIEFFRTVKNRDIKILDAFKKSKTKFGMVAVDEVHKVANKSSSQGSNLLQIKADHMIAATGTLITNNAISAYVPLSWTDNDKATLTDYKKTYCEFGGFNDSQIIGYKNLELLREEIEHCSIRRTLDMVREDMPKLQIEYELIEMDDADSKFYESIKNGVKDEAMKVELNSSNLLALTTRLRQATACPSALTENEVFSSKLHRAVDIAEEILSQGQKVVILGNFKESVYELAKELAAYKPVICTGDIADGVINQGMQSFQTDPNCNVFIGTTSKTGTGITLNASMYLIFIDTPWTWSDFEQGYSRVYRVDNVNPAFIKVLSCQGTIDESVWEAINLKKDTSKYLVDGEVTPEFLQTLKDIILNL